MNIPTTREVRQAWIAVQLGKPEATAEFDTWLATVKAEAWEQGADSAYYDPEIRGQVNYPDNPYRKEQKNG